MDISYLMISVILNIPLSKYKSNLIMTDIIEMLRNVDMMMIDR